MQTLSETSLFLENESDNFGVLAHLVERNTGSVEVRSSSLLCSTSGYRIKKGVSKWHTFLYGCVHRKAHLYKPVSALPEGSCFCTSHKPRKRHSETMTVIDIQESLTAFAGDVREQRPSDGDECCTVQNNCVSIWTVHYNYRLKAV